MKKVALFGLLSLFCIFLPAATAMAGAYSYKNTYTIAITTTASDASGTVTLPRQSNGLAYTATLSVTTDPNTPCFPNCLYYKEVTGINKTITESFSLRGLDPSKKYYFLVSDTSKKHSLPFQVDGARVFTAVGSPTNIEASLTGLRGNTNSFRLLVLNRPFEANDIARFMYGGIAAAPGLPLHPGEDVIKKPDANGEIRWNIDGFFPGTTYYVRVIEYADRSDPSTAFYTTEQKTVATQPVTITPDPMIFDYTNGGALIKGRLDPAKNPNHEKYTVQIQYSKSAIAEGDPKYPVYQTHEAANTTQGVAADGTYHVFVPSLLPSTSYNVRETIAFGGSRKVTDGVFNSARGYTPSTDTQTIQTDFEDRSYRLLAPFPGLNILFDPDLCQEQVALGKPVFGGSCDDQVSAFINLALKILIGAAAVLLVLRIMFIGYRYITTDIPALKTTAKSGLWDAVLGLVLALSSYLILNTINPKLLENTISIQRLEIDVDEDIVNEVGSGVTINGQRVAIKKGSAASCSGGLVPISGAQTATGAKICNDLLIKMQELNKKLTGWQITSTVTGSHSSSCHSTGTASSGNCVDIQLTSGPRQGCTDQKCSNGSSNAKWGDVCVALAQIQGISFLNEASIVPNCTGIAPFLNTKFKTGPHLHIIYTGK